MGTLDGPYFLRGYARRVGEWCRRWTAGIALGTEAIGPDQAELVAGALHRAEQLLLDLADAMARAEEER